MRRLVRPPLLVDPSKSATSRALLLLLLRSCDSVPVVHTRVFAASGAGCACECAWTSGAGRACEYAASVHGRTEVPELPPDDEDAPPPVVWRRVRRLSPPRRLSPFG